MSYQMSNAPPTHGTEPRSFDSDLERPSHPSTSTQNSNRFGTHLTLVEGSILLRPANSSNNSQPQHSHSSATLGSKATGQAAEEYAVFYSSAMQQGGGYMQQPSSAGAIGIVGGHRPQSRMQTEGPSHGSLAQLWQQQGAAGVAANANIAPLLYMAAPNVPLQQHQPMPPAAQYTQLPPYYTPVVISSPTNQVPQYQSSNAHHQHLFTGVGAQQRPASGTVKFYPTQSLPGQQVMMPQDGTTDPTGNNNSSFCSSSPQPTSADGRSYNSSYQTLQGSFAVDARNRLLLPTNGGTTSPNPQGQAYSAYANVRTAGSPQMAHHPLSAVSLVSMQPQVSPSSTFMVSSSQQGMQEGAVMGPPLLQAIHSPGQQQGQYQPYMQNGLPPQHYAPPMVSQPSYMQAQVLYNPTGVVSYPHQLYTDPSQQMGSAMPMAGPSAYPHSPAPANGTPPPAAAKGNKDNLYVSGLPMECRDADLNGLFESVIGALWPLAKGEEGAPDHLRPLGTPTTTPPKILSGSVRMNINTGVSRGFGFVKVSSDEAAAALLSHLDTALVGMVDAIVSSRDDTTGQPIGTPVRKRVLRVLRGGGSDSFVDLAKPNQVMRMVQEDGRVVLVETQSEVLPPSSPMLTTRLHIVFAQSVADYNPAALMPKVFARNFPATVSFADAEALFSKRDGYTSMIYQKGAPTKNRPNNAVPDPDPLGSYSPDAASRMAESPITIAIEPRQLGAYGFYNVYATFSSVDQAVQAAHDLHNTKSSLPLDQQLAALITRLQQLMPLLMGGAQGGVAALVPPHHPLFLTKCFEHSVAAFAAESSLPVESTVATIMGQLRSLLGKAAEAAPMITSANSGSPTSPKPQQDDNLLLRFLNSHGHKVLLEAAYLACRGEVSCITGATALSPHPPSVSASIRAYFGDRNNHIQQSPQSPMGQLYSPALLSDIIPLLSFASPGDSPPLEPIPILAKVAEDIEFRRKRLEAKTRGGPNNFQGQMGNSRGGGGGGGYVSNGGRGGRGGGMGRGRGAMQQQFWPQQQQQHQQQQQQHHPSPYY